MMMTQRAPRPVMGLTDVVGQLPRAVLALRSLVREAARLRPAAAVLIDYTEFNFRLGRRLRACGVRVLWCVAPQVWAWRAGRTGAIASAFDRLAVILPFERALWAAVGADVHYVGHPALDAELPCPATRAKLRRRWGVPLDGTAIALLPGSRAHEVRRHLGPILAGVRQLGRERHLHARLLLAGGLDDATRAWAAGQLDPEHVVTVDATEGAASALAAFDASVVASGTATLESALAGTPPVVVYRTSPLTAWAARRMLRVPHVALPNVLLASGRYPELLQGDLHPAGVATALGMVLDERPSFAALPARLRTILSPHPDGASATPTPQRVPSRIAALLDDWLGDERSPGAAHG